MSSTSASNESRLRVNRRGFMKASGAGAAFAAATIGAVPFSQSKAFAQQGWDEEHDIVVVGSGGAAFSAAITANALGSDVVMLEKGAYAGGTTLVSGAGLWVPNNRFLQEQGIEDSKDDALKYMARYSFPHLYNPDDEKLGLSDHDFDMINTFFDTAHEAVSFLEEAGAIDWYQMVNAVGGGYNDYMDHFEENTVPQGRSIMPLDPDGNPGYGGVMIASYLAHAERVGIPVLLNHRVERVVLNDAGEVIGVEVTINDGSEDGATPSATPVGVTKTFRARKGVIFGSGGFMRNPDLMRHLMNVPHYGGCGAPTNEGDFIRISSAVGAKLGNLNEAWRQESIFEQAVASSAAYNCIPYINGDSFIQVDKNGRRYVNEKRNYTDRPKTHFNWDANNADWATRLTFIVWDERVQQNWGGSFPYPKDPAGAPYVITGETLEELAANMAERMESLSAHTGGVTVSENFAANFLDEVAAFNEYASTGEDLDWQRGSFAYDREIPSMASTLEPYPSDDQPNVAMYPISEAGPYYAAIVSVGTFDTSGGPVINPDAQILTWNDTPVVGLYGAGNCVASPSVAAYWGGGTTLGLAHTFGYRAAVHAHNSEEKSA